MQTVAARSITASTHARGSSRDTSPSAASWSRPGGTASPTTRPTTRRTLTSSGATGTPNADAATARAVYGPTPGSRSSSGTVPGTCPPCSRTIVRAASRSASARRLYPSPAQARSRSRVSAAASSARLRPQPDEPLPRGPDPLDLGLLGHDLGDEDGPRLGGVADRQVAARRDMPRGDGAAEPGSGRWSRARRGHGVVPEARDHSSAARMSATAGVSNRAGTPAGNRTRCPPTAIGRPAPARRRRRPAALHRASPAGAGRGNPGARCRSRCAASRPPRAPRHAGAAPPGT